MAWSHPEVKSNLRVQVWQDEGELARGRLRGRVVGMKAGGGASRHQQNDVFTGRNAGSLLRRCGGSLGFWRSWCGAAVRVCQTFSSPS